MRRGAALADAGSRRARFGALPRALRKLVLGETWALPAGVTVALVVAAAVRALAGPHGWWHEAGGWVLFGLLAAALAVALRPGRL